MTVDVALGLLHFVELRLALKVIQQEDAGIFWEAKSGSNLRKVRALGFAVGGFLLFLVECSGLGNGGGAVSLVFFGSRPIHQRGRKFFPFVAFGAFVADAVAFYLVLGDQLIGAVFQDETVGEILGRSRNKESETEHGESDGGKP